jgi:hypothetical protein
MHVECTHDRVADLRGAARLTGRRGQILSDSPFVSATLCVFPFELVAVGNLVALRGIGKDRRVEMGRYVRFMLLTGLLAGTNYTIAGQDEVSIAVRPAVVVARGEAQLKILVERDDRNRSLTWEVDGPAYYRSSRVELDGSSAPRSWFFFVRDLPEGEYDVRATVSRNDRSSAVAISNIRVMGGMR